MSFSDSIRVCFQKYIVFSGRAQRPEYWWFILFTFVISVVLGIIATFLAALQILEVVFSLAVLLPSLAVQTRRLHDMNRSAWWLLLLLLPIIGVPVLLIMSIFPGTPGPNRYGPNPLQPQQGTGGYGYPDPDYSYLPPTSDPYASPTSGSYSEPGYGALPPETEPSGRQFCTQCGMQLQPEARFCTACGASA